MKTIVQGHRLARLGARITCGEDDGMNHGVVNWFVTGGASTSRGVRINNGGRARVEVVTRDDRRYTVVVDDLGQARDIVQVVRTAQSGERRTPSRKT